MKAIRHGSTNSSPQARSMGGGYDELGFMGGYNGQLPISGLPIKILAYNKYMEPLQQVVLGNFAKARFAKSNNVKAKMRSPQDE